MFLNKRNPCNKKFKRENINIRFYIWLKIASYKYLENLHTCIPLHLIFELLNELYIMWRYPFFMINKIVL